MLKIDLKSTKKNSIERIIMPRYAVIMGKEKTELISLTPARQTRVLGNFHLRYDVMMDPISRIDLTNETVSVLVNYCKLCNATNYEGVRVACKYAMDNIIRVAYSNQLRLAKNCKEYAEKLDFFVNKTAAELGIFPSIINAGTLWKLKTEKEDEEKNPNPAEFLYYTHLLMPNLDPNHFSKNMNSIRTAVNTFWDRLTGVRHSSMQSMLYLFSVEGGVGKSVFQNIIEEWAKSRKVNYAFSRAPHNQFVGDEFNKNAVVIFSDITQDECKNWARLNDLVDGTKYVVEKKGEDRYELKAQAFLIGSSNFHPKDDNNRRIANSLVYFGATKLEPISNFPDVFVLKNGAVDIEHYIPIVDKWITSCPDNGFDFRKYATGIESSAGDWFEDLAVNYQFILRDIIAKYCITKDWYLEPHGYVISTATLRNQINKYIRKEEFDSVDPNETLNIKTVYYIIKRLHQKGKIKLAEDSKDAYAKKFNLKPLVDNAVIIAAEHIVDNRDDPSKGEKADYERQREIVAEVANAILKENPQPVSEECQAFLNSMTPTKTTAQATSTGPTTSDATNQTPVSSISATDA